MLRDSGHTVSEWSDPEIYRPQEVAMEAVGLGRERLGHNLLATALANLNDKDRACYDILARAAEAGERCPRNEDLCIPLGHASGKGPANTIARLVKAGLIVVERYAQGRAVVIKHTGKHTKRPNCLTGHWRDVGAIGTTNNNTNPVVAEIIPPPINRDPCPRCGVRRDIGCTHTASRLTNSYGRLAA